MNEILKEIEEARKSKNWSQSDVAAMLGIGLRQYQNIEAGKFPKYKTKQVKELEEILNIKIYEKIYEENVPREIRPIPVNNAADEILERLIKIQAHIHILYTSEAERAARESGIKVTDVLRQMDASVRAETNILMDELRQKT